MRAHVSGVTYPSIPHAESKQRAWEAQPTEPAAVSSDLKSWSCSNYGRYLLCSRMWKHSRKWQEKSVLPHSQRSRKTTEVDHGHKTGKNGAEENGALGALRQWAPSVQWTLHIRYKIQLRSNQPPLRKRIVQPASIYEKKVEPVSTRFVMRVYPRHYGNEVKMTSKQKPQTLFGFSQWLSQSTIWISNVSFQNKSHLNLVSDLHSAVCTEGLN